MDLMNALQWPSPWLPHGWLALGENLSVNWGFWLFMFSNVLWIIWGLHDRAFALISLQICLGFLNVRVVVKSRAK
jgi:hypothetical protein